MTEPRFHVGQKVRLRSVNARRSEPEVVTVTKVGRVNVYVELGPEWTSKPFGIDDGRIKDNYGHEWLETEEQYQEGLERAKLLERISTAGWRPERPTAGRTASLTLLRDLADLLEGDAAR